MTTKAESHSLCIFIQSNLEINPNEELDELPSLLDNLLAKNVLAKKFSNVFLL